MNIRKQLWLITCATLFTCSGTVTAQKAKDMPDRPEKHYKPAPLSPEKSAQHTTDRMDSLLNLTKKQYDKLYKLNLKWARKDMKSKDTPPRMDGKPEGAPGFGGAKGPGPGPRENRPPEGVERRPPGDFAPSNDRGKMEKQYKKREKKLKKVLTDKQYARWVEQQHPVIQEGRNKGKRQ